MRSAFPRLWIVLLAAGALGAAVTVATDERRVTAGAVQEPDWEHIRIVGGQLGVPRAMAIGGEPARSVGIGDVDGDGDADIVVGAAGAPGVAVLMGNRSGRVVSTIHRRSGDWPTVDAVADVDGTTYRARSIALSSITSVRHATDAARRTSQNPPSHFAVAADFNQDGIIDVAGVAAGSASLAVYLGHVRGGSTLTATVPLDAAAGALACGDFDGDGRSDIAIADSRSSRVTLVFGDGAGGFERQRSFDAGTIAAALAAADLDGDDVADLVLAGRSGEVNVLLGTGSGTLGRVDSIAVDRSQPSYGEPAAANLASGEYEGVASLTLGPSTITGGSGATSTGTITLNAPAPSGGIVVTLASSNPELAASVPTVTVPAGASTASFVIGTNANYRRYSGLAFTVSISATHGTTTQNALLSVTAQARPGPLSSFDVQNEGQMCLGVGVRQSQNGISLEFGSAGNLFDCVAPDDPGQDGTCTFRQECTFGCETRPVSNGSRFSDVCAATPPFPVAVTPKLLVGGNPSQATLQLSAAAPANSSGLLSSLTVLANTFPNISTPIPAGVTTASAQVLTARVNAPRFAPIDGTYNTPGSDGSRRGRIGLTWIALVPGTPPPFELRSFDFDSPTLTSVVGGTALFAFGQMNQVAPAPAVGTAMMIVTSSHPSAASIPQPEVSFTEGSSNAGTAIQTHAVSQDTVVTLSATIGDSTLTRQLTVRATPGATRVNSFFLDPFDVPGGSPSTGLVVLDGSAPSGGLVVALESLNTAVATMPATVTVPAGSDRVSFQISTSPVSSNTTVTLRAGYNGTWTLTSLIVTPSASPVALSSLGVSPASVAGGSSAAGTIALTAAAPNGGSVVSLSSSSGAASVPASVTVPAGAQSASFAIATTTVASTTTATITATFGGASRTASLTITAASSSTPSAPALVAPASGATVALPVTLDWSDVTGAASYRIQVDDSSGFTTPLVVDQTVSSSQFSTSALASRQHWWRVSAVNSSGTAGAWSSVRTFTPQAAAPGPGVVLTVTATGRSGERITSSPSGINVGVGSTASASFAAGTSITLSVSNGREAVWSGACSSGGNKRRTCTFTLNAAASVTANVR